MVTDKQPTQPGKPTLRAVGGTAVRPTREEIEHITKVLSAFRQEVPKEWTQDSVEESRSKVKLLEVLL
jgi:hypothetical protein